jgi:drug/metabolite transporter (DMT)-like permease
MFRNSGSAERHVRVSRKTTSPAFYRRMNERTSAQKKALVSVIICVLFWGVSFVSSKVAVTVFPPITLGAFRFALAIVFLVFIKGRLAPGEKLNVRDLPLLAGAGLTGVTAYFFCENNGVSLVSASEASIIVAAIPVLTVAAEWIGGRFRRGAGRGAAPFSSVRLWSGALISGAGVWLVAGVSFSVSGSILGYLYMGGAALSRVFKGRPPGLFARRPVYCLQNGADRFQIFV